ncbi:methyl-accepting chemotaxis protein [Sporomusaceae bacterium BoRhaA]|uniref:methyl-accepting chemotaxis protein n=1 Tax=Pelorhabdus rhamnosifermentans TaxID=2772457 RepID=UPI001FE33255|nr:methyl-accepting chemotaxis protein [Pelorhabdus rhamnosifermentans]MBU2701075.1 methyl-accepting chemotaxis protein [Pelorhabdus rhamnosifermentans]
MNMKVHSFQTKLLLVLLPFFILSFVILSGSSYYLSKNSLMKSANELGVATGTDYANQTLADMNEKIAQLEDLASIQRIRNGNDPNQITQAMAETRARLHDFDTIFFITPDGSGFRSDGSKGQYQDREYFQQVLKTKKSTVSDPLISRTTGKISVILAVPVTYNNQVTGVLAATYSLEKLSDTLKQLTFKDTGYGFIVDSSGLLLAHPQLPETVGKLNFMEKKLNSELKLKDTELDDRLMTLFKSTVSTGKSQVGKYQFQNVDMITTFTPIALPGDKHWFIGVSAPETEVMQEMTTLTRTMLTISFLFILLAVFFVIMMSKRFTKPLILIRDECLLLTQGDLRERQVTVQSEDEIGQLAKGFRDMRTHIRGLVKSVQSQAEQVAASSEELTASAQQSADAANQVAGSITEIAAGTDKQAAAANNISSVAEELSVSTEQIATTTRDVANIAQNTSHEAAQGRQAVEQALAQMQQIGQGSKAVQTAIAELAKGSREISEIVTLISTIAGQTNLLALNAAIEAARAGEQGRGFAVVAEEVRKLAEESNEAAQQIGELIKRNQVNMDQAIAATELGTNNVQTGVHVVNLAGETFNKIVSSIIQLSSQIQGISESITQMAVGSHHLVESIHEIDTIGKQASVEAQTVSAATEEQSASMQEIASSSHSLAQLASNLQEAVAKFKS